MALYVLLQVTRRCKARSRFCALLLAFPRKKPDQAKRSDTTKVAMLKDLFLAMSGVHNRRPIWNFTYPRVAGAVQRAASKAGLGTVTLHQRASVDMARQYWSLDAVQKKRSLVASKEHAQVRTQQSNRSRLWKAGRGCPRAVGGVREISSRNHAGNASSCDSNMSKVDHVARSWLLRLSATWKCSVSSVDPLWLLFLRTSLLVEGKLPGPPRPRGSEPELGTRFWCKKFELVSKRSPFPFETRCHIRRSSGCLSHTAKCSNFNAHPTSCSVLVRLFVAKRGIPTALVQASASPL